ncbi:helix-turn-helix domain-containing protein [Anaerocolumna sp. AGMB13025]|uniref:PucR family transcriptional regulator n=1 Tax=Anaerocolumna sp. AGMB13025 TaxID=3039116 RepID=UPI00241E290E|nr:helix-turn-helix domain-containing protein [Anaerocolumna sp. AGMB13025]WFR55855.1 helix-turn-helix domain-containing protein [Anaerocolumna sp. AGMB13025]
MEFNKYDSREIRNPEIKVALDMQELSDAFFANKSLQTLIDKARKILDRPLMLYDSSYKVLAASFDASSVFQFEYNENSTQYLSKASDDFIFSNHSPEDKKPILYFSPKDKSLFQGMLIASIKIDIIEVARFIVLEGGMAFQETDYMLLEKLRPLLAAQLQRNILLNLDNNHHPAYILSDLIEGRTDDNTVLHGMKSNPNWIRSNSIYIIVICNSIEEAFDNKVSIVFRTLKSYIPVEQRIIYHSAIVAFVDEILYAALFDSQSSTFHKFLEENNLYAGISQKFSALTEAKKQYQYALDALLIDQKRNSHCSSFDDCTLYIISDMISDRYDPMDICHPAVISLINYDNENCSSLLDTLKQYIYYTSAPAEAAKALNIHRNTLFYRIGKIKEITGIMLDNGDEKSRIFMSIRLLESKGIIP